MLCMIISNFKSNSIALLIVYRHNNIKRQCID